MTHQCSDQPGHARKQVISVPPQGNQATVLIREGALLWNGCELKGQRPCRHTVLGMHRPFYVADLTWQRPLVLS